MASTAKRLPCRLRNAPWLVRPETQAVFAALEAEGAKARCVGGALRNWLLGQKVSDIDIATTATPDDAAALAERAGLKVIATGLSHGTITILSGGVAHEVTTLRRDVETDGRHARIAYTTDWKADAGRRDFTINALYCDAAGRLFDPLGGLDDLLARRLRFIGNAAERIGEDYLRILRFFRFNAQYGPPDNAQIGKAEQSQDGNDEQPQGGKQVMRLDREGLSACIKARAGLARLSVERISSEMFKILAAPAGLATIQLMYETGFLPYILGIAPQLSNLRRLAVIEGKLELPPDPALRLAALTIMVHENVAKLARRLRLSKKDTCVLAQAVLVAGDCGGGDRRAWLSAPDNSTARRLLYRLGANAYRQRLLLAWARSGAVPADLSWPCWAAALSLAQRWTIPKCPVSGADVLALGIPPGPAVGEILRRFEDWWIDSDFPSDSAVITQRLRNLAGASPPGQTR